MDCISPSILFIAAIAMIVYVIKLFGKNENGSEGTEVHQSSASGEDDDGMVRIARGMIMLDMLEYGIPPWNVGDNENDCIQTNEEDYDTDIDYEYDDFDDSDYEGYDD